MSSKVIATTDWDFADANIHYATHGLHSYPARMIPQVANRLIELYSKQDATLLDPFCGSGSVLVESVLLGRECYGIDINPLACLLARVKSTPIDPKKLMNIWSKMRNDILVTLKFERKHVKPPDFSGVNIGYWFKPQTIEELAVIKSFIDDLEDLHIREFFYACFSNTVRAVSGTRKGEFKLYRIPSEEWEQYRPNTFEVVDEKVTNGISRMGEFWSLLRNRKIGKPHVIEGDTRKLYTDAFPSKPRITEGSVNIVVTSPPYGDSHTTVAYGQFSRYSLLWLGYSKERALAVDKESLGGRRRSGSLNSETLNATLSRIKHQTRTWEVESFFIDMNECLEKLEMALVAGGHACFVLGNRTVSGIKIPADQILVELGHPLGLRLEATVHRRIPSKRIPWKSSPTNIPGKGVVETISRENIVVLKKT